MTGSRLIVPVLLGSLSAPVAIPFQEGTRVEGSVVIPIEEYRALRAKAFPPDREPDPPPVDAVLTRVEYDLRVTGDTAAGEARLTIDVFKDGWVKVPIPPGLGLQVREARLDGRPVSLIGGAGAAEVLLSRPGRAVLALDVAAPVTATAGTESLTLPAAAAPVTRATLVVPRGSVEATVTGGFLAERGGTDQESRLLAFGHAGEALTFAWRRKAEDRRATLPLRLRGSVTQVVGLGEDNAQVTADVRLEVVQGAAAAVGLGLPDGLVVNQVTGPLVADWESRPGHLTVTFLEPVERETSLAVVAEMRSPRDGLVAVPLLRLSEAERETGGVAVEVLGAGEIRDRQAKGLDPADPADLGAVVAGRDALSLVAFRFRAQDGKGARSLAVAVSRYTPQAVLVANVEEARYQTLLTEDGKTLVRARYAIRNNQRSFLGITLPADATLWSAATAGRPARPGRSPEGALLLPLEKGRTGEEAPPFLVEVVYLQRGSAWAERGSLDLPLPTLDLPVSRTGLVIHHSPRFRLETAPGAFRVESFADPLSPAFHAASVPHSALRALAAPEAPKPSREGDEALKDQQGLVERFQKEGRVLRVAGIQPVQVPFPELGTLLFLTSELSAEGRAPSIRFDYRRGGAR